MTASMTKPESARWECWTCKDRSLSIAAQSAIKAWAYEYRRGPKAAEACRSKGHDVREVKEVERDS